MESVTNILFDLDGTLTNSRRGMLRSYQFAMVRMRRPVPTLADLERSLCTPVRENLSVLLGTSDAETLDRAERLFAESFAGGAMYDFEICPGVEQMLCALAQSGVRLFVVSAKPQIVTESILESAPFARHISGCFGSGGVGDLAERMALLRHVIEMQGLDVERSALIGDQRVDILAGNRMGLLTIGVLWGFGTLSEFTEARYIACTPSDLVGLFTPAQGLAA